MSHEVQGLLNRVEYSNMTTLEDFAQVYRTVAKESSLVKALISVFNRCHTHALMEPYLQCMRCVPCPVTRCLLARMHPYHHTHTLSVPLSLRTHTEFTTGRPTSARWSMTGRA